MFGLRILASTCVVVALQVPAPQRPTFQARTDLVTLDVTVTDERGTPVLGLTEADFSILEDGKPQTLSVFRAISMDAPAWATPWLAATRHDVVTNAPAAGRLIAIVVDDAMMSDLGSLNATRTAATALIEMLGSEDRATIVFSRDSRGAQPFTSDRARLLAAVERATLGFAGMGGPHASVTQSHHAVGALRTLEDLVQMLGTSGHFPRSLIYVGSGVSIDTGLASAPGQVGGLGSMRLAAQGVHSTYVARLQNILRHAASRNIAVHMVDPNGPTASEFHLTIARATGGVATVSSVNAEDARREMVRIDAATRATYLLGYVPAVIATGIRRTEVKVNRPGLIVRTRAYYERLTAEELARLEARKPPAEIAALAGMLPEPGLPLRVSAVALPVAQSRQAVVAIVLGVRHPVGEARATENLTVVTGAYDMEGRFKAGARGRIQVQMRGTPGETAEYETYVRLPLSPGRYQLRLSIDHPMRRETGSVYTDVDVPDFSKPGLHLAGPLLDAGPARMKAAPVDRFLHDLPVLPTVQRDFPVGMRLLAFVRLVQGGRTPLTPVDVTAQLIDATGAVVRTTRETVSEEQFRRARAADYQVGITTENLAPGPYLLTIEAVRPGEPPSRADVTLTMGQSRSFSSNSASQ